MTTLDHRAATFTEPTGPNTPPPMPAPKDLQLKRPANVNLTYRAGEAPISDKGRWVLPIVLLGLPLLFLAMLALGFVTAR